MTEIIWPLVLGFGFGFSLQKGGLSKYHKIVNVFRFTDLTVMKYIMATLAVAMAGTFALRDMGLLSFPGIPPTYVAGNLIGGLVFGVGMAAAGF